MPRHVFFDRRHGDTPVDGGGDWKLQKGTSYWEVRLSFRGVPEYPQGFDTSVVVIGSGDSTTLFQWIEDQGGQMIKRQPSPPADDAPLRTHLLAQSVGCAAAVAPRACAIWDPTSGRLIQEAALLISP